jgi:hypothetical protein
MIDIQSLENWLWDAACAIRGPVDAPKFKDYILPFGLLIKPHLQLVEKFTTDNTDSPEKNSVSSVVNANHLPYGFQMTELGLLPSS